MAAEMSRRRSRSRFETPDEADAVRYGSRASPASSDATKRMRLRGGRDMEEDNDEDDYGDMQRSNNEFHSFLDDSSAAPRTNRPTAAFAASDGTSDGTSDDTFQPGAIVRVKLENFVTYESAEFFPGPNLNMIIGPNGTGKSSLVCAICLGLGYHTNVLGRASSFGEFVKHGKDNAVVEVELQKGRGDARNHVVRLRINREDNNRKFWLNGKEVPHKSIRALMQKSRIQIDNLCQFLPQDKVAEFAGLNSIDLLTKTLEAAAPQQMIEDQGRLKAMFSQQKEMQHLLEADNEQLRGMETRQQGLETDVQRLREREQIQQGINELREARILVMYNEAKERYHQGKKAKKEAENRQRRLEQECEPSLKAVNEKQEYEKRLKTAVDVRKRRLKEAEAAADEAIRKVENINGQMKNLENDKSAKQSSMTTKKQTLQSIRHKITDLQAKLKSNRKEFNAGEWNRKIREQEHLNREIESEIRAIETEQMAQIKEQGKAKMFEAKAIDAEIENFESQQGQAFSQLKKINPHAAKFWEWVQSNQDQFEKEVFGPPMLLCSVKDNRYSALIQSLLQNDDFFCFTAQTKNDHKRLTDEVYQKQGLSVTVRSILSGLESFRPPVPHEQLKELGFDAYALDLLEGPKPVLAMLASEKRIHASAVALHDLTDEQYNKNMKAEIINSFAAGKTSYRIVRRREYGAGATSTTTRQIRPGRFWTDQPADAGEKAELQRRARECRGEIEELRTQLNGFKSKHEELGQKQLAIREKLDELRTSKSQLQREYNQWQLLPEKIETETKNRDQEIAALQETKLELRKIDNEFDNLALKKADLVLKHQQTLDAIRAAYQVLLEVQIRLIEATSDVAGLKDKNAHIVQRLKEEREKIREFQSKTDELKKVAVEAHDAAQTVLLSLDDSDDAKATALEKRNYLIQLSGQKSSEEISEDISAEESKMELIHAADPGLLEEFQNRALSIERLTKQKASKEQKLVRLDQEIHDVREKWEPGLDEIISRINDAFSYNFEQINCAGEVGVHKDEDFDKWAIEIKVKFRENETLQKLDQHRQSGGERAVSTVFYLMSLQSMAQSPFRVVDEINQGMDPRNERMVHERMVEIACREHTSQYFLITPKLLSGLRYDERMKVLCIASGEHMPGDWGKLDFARCAKIKRQLVAAASA